MPKRRPLPGADPEQHLRLVAQTVRDLFPRATLAELKTDPEHGNKYGEGESLEEAQEFSLRARAIYMRAEQNVILARARDRSGTPLRPRSRARPCGRRPSGRPRGRSARTSRAGPDDPEGEPADPGARR